MKKKKAVKIPELHKLICDDAKYWKDSDYNVIINQLVDYILQELNQENSDKSLLNLFRDCLSEIRKQFWVDSEFPVIRLFGWLDVISKEETLLYLKEDSNQLLKAICHIKDSSLTVQDLKSIGKKYGIKNINLTKDVLYHKILKKLAINLQELNLFYGHCQKYKYSYLWNISPKKEEIRNWQAAQASYPETILNIDGDILNFFASAEVTNSHLHFYKEIIKNGDKTNLTVIKSAMNKTFNTILFLILKKRIG